MEGEKMESDDRSMTFSSHHGLVRVFRPEEGDMYGIFLEKDGEETEISMIGGNTGEAMTVFNEAKKIFNRPNIKLEDAKKEIIRFIQERHNN